MTTRAALANTVRTRLPVDTGILPDAAVDAALSAALAEYSAVFPRVRPASLALVAGQAAHPAPADLVAVISATWSEAFQAAAKSVHPWDRADYGAAATMPVITLAEGSFLLSPPPSAAAIAAFGASFTYTYRANHMVDDTAPAVNTLPPDGEEPVLVKTLELCCAVIAATANQSDEFVARYERLEGKYAELYKTLVAATRKPAVIR